MMGIFKVFPVKGFSLFTMFLRVCLKAFNVLAKNNCIHVAQTHTHSLKWLSLRLQCRS